MLTSTIYKKQLVNQVHETLPVVINHACAVKKVGQVD